MADSSLALRTAQATRRSQRVARQVRVAPKFRVITLFVAPALIVYAIFFLWPILSALSNAFFSWHGTARAGFVGVGNFRTLFSLQPYASELVTALKNNLYFFVGTMVLQNGIGLLLAFLMNRAIPGKRLFQTVISVPYLMSALVIGYAWGMLLSPYFGVVNGVLRGVGLTGVNWLGTPSLVMPIIIVITAWQWCGVPMLIFGAALGGIPHEQIEAARTDGASALRIAWSIQLPQIIPAWSIVTVLTLIGSLNLFDLVYAVGGGSGGGVGGAALVLGTLFYNISFGQDINSYGLSGAMSVLQLVLTLVVTMGAQAVFRAAERRLG